MVDDGAVVAVGLPPGGGGTGVLALGVVAGGVFSTILLLDLCRIS